MKPERWQQIDNLLQSALARSPEERSAFLARACDEDDAWLDNAYEAHSFVLIELKVNPMFDTLRSDPRFVDLLGRMRLAP